MTEMVERVARAICNEINDQPYDALPEAETYRGRKTHVHRPILDRQEARDVARAAIEAMRKPTDAMERSCGNGECAKWAPGAWVNYIDAALSDGTEP